MKPGFDTRYEATEVLPKVFGGFDHAKRLNILDLGSAVPESFSFYHRYWARICIVDAINEWTSGIATDLSDIVPDRARGLCFDICLLWDSLNYLSTEAMNDFARDISGYLHAGTRIHAIAAYTPAWAFDAFRYGIDDHDRIVIKPQARTVPHPHSQSDIERALPGYRIQHTVLRPGNRLELLLARTRG